MFDELDELDPGDLNGFAGALAWQCKLAVDVDSDRAVIARICNRLGELTACIVCGAPQPETLYVADVVEPGARLCADCESKGAAVAKSFD